MNVRMYIKATAAGTAGNKILVGGLPANIADHNNLLPLVVGIGAVLDSGTTIYQTAACAYDATTIQFFRDGEADFLGLAPAMTLANNDEISMTLTYEVA
jgi:hypothetical protein